MAPPRKPIDMDLVKKLAYIQCTEAEIASVLGVHRSTLIRNKKFVKNYKDSLQGGRSSLRRLQFKTAEAGNATMQIWLGKQYLNQTDKQEIAGKDGGPIEHSIDAKGKLISAIDRIASRAGEVKNNTKPHR